MSKSPHSRLGTDPQSTAATDPGPSTIRIEPMRRQEPFGSGLAQVGWWKSAQTIAGREKLLLFQSSRNTEKFQLSAPTKRTIVNISLRTRRSSNSLTREETQDAPLPYPHFNKQPKSTNKSCLSEVVEEVVTAVAVAASEVRRIILLLSTVIAHLDVVALVALLPSTIGATQGDSPFHPYFFYNV